MRTGRGAVGWGWAREERPFEGAVKMCRPIEPGHLLVWEGMEISSSGLEGRGQERYLSSMERRLMRVRYRDAFLMRLDRDGGFGSILVIRGILTML